MSLGSWASKVSNSLKSNFVGKTGLEQGIRSVGTAVGVVYAVPHVVGIFKPGEKQNEIGEMEPKSRLGHLVKAAIGLGVAALALYANVSKGQAAGQSLS